MPDIHPIHGPIFDDRDFTQLTGQNYTPGWAPPPADHNPRGYSQMLDDATPIIPDHEIDARIDEQGQLSMRVSDRITWRATDQGKWPTCWAAGTCHAVTTARAFAGQSIEMISPMSVAYPISGGNNGGFEGVAVKYFIEHGGVRESLWGPTDRRNIRGPAIDADRLRLRITDAYECITREHFVTACLLGWPCTVAFSAWRHVVMLCDFVRIEPGSYGFRIRNNWGDEWGDKNRHGVGGFAVFRETARIGTPTSGFAIRAVRQAEMLAI